MSSMPVPRTAIAPPALEDHPTACRVLLADRDVEIPASAHTLSGFRTWAKSESFPERGRFSFIDGEILVDMSPEEIETHIKVKAEIGRVLLNWNRKAKRGEFLTDGTLVTNEAANLSTVPDSVFVTWETQETGRVRLVPREGEEGQFMEVEGTPDWVLEVISKYSVRKDSKWLRESYFLAGIPEYWLVDARGEEVDFQILVRGESDYQNEPQRGGWQKSPVFGRRFRLVRQRGRMNHWEYTLETKK
jgi:Uma2 family endonuclease